jgi:hypothetical protein
MNYEYTLENYISERLNKLYPEASHELDSCEIDELYNELRRLQKECHKNGKNIPGITYYIIGFVEDKKRIKKKIKNILEMI